MHAIALSVVITDHLGSSDAKEHAAAYGLTITDTLVLSDSAEVVGRQGQRNDAQKVLFGSAVLLAPVARGPPGRTVVTH